MQKDEAKMGMLTSYSLTEFQKPPGFVAPLTVLDCVHHTNSSCDPRLATVGVSITQLCMGLAYLDPGNLVCNLTGSDKRETFIVRRQVWSAWVGGKERRQCTKDGAVRPSGQRIC